MRCRRSCAVRTASHWRFIRHLGFLGMGNGSPYRRHRLDGVRSCGTHKNFVFGRAKPSTSSFGLKMSPRCSTSGQDAKQRVSAERSLLLTDALVQHSTAAGTALKVVLCWHGLDRAPLSVQLRQSISVWQAAGAAVALGSIWRLLPRATLIGSHPGMLSCSFATSTVMAFGQGSLRWLTSVPWCRYRGAYAFHAAPHLRRELPLMTAD
jgi:hypothetical protein